MLRIENVSKYFGNKCVLKNLCLEIPERTIYGLVGINGAGKSTLLRMIAGVYGCDEGRIAFNGADTLTDASVRRGIAYVADEPYYPAGATVGSVRAFYEAMYDFDPVRFEKCCRVFELKETDVLRTLSKGMKRRAALVFALSIQPKLLLLDEAYDGLEPLARLKFKKLLAELLEDENLTVVICGHNLKELEDICDSFGILSDGQIVEGGDLSDRKEAVNKYQAVFEEVKQEADFQSLDLLHFEAEGRVCRLVVRGEEETVVSALKQMNPLLLDVLPVSFEELFIYEVERRGLNHEG